MNELIKELREWYMTWTVPMYMPPEGENQFKKILSRHDKTVEPLAVLADRKGFWKVGFTRSCDAMAKDFWVCVIQKLSFDIRIDKQRDYDFVAPTYPAAEKAARQYLNGLEDK